MLVTAFLVLEEEELVVVVFVFIWFVRAPTAGDARALALALGVVPPPPPPGADAGVEEGIGRAENMWRGRCCLVYVGGSQTERGRGERESQSFTQRWRSREQVGTIASQCMPPNSNPSVDGAEVKARQ